MQIAQLYASIGLVEPSRAASCMACTATDSGLEVSVQGIRHALLARTPLTRHPCINISFPFPIVQLKVVIGQAGHPSVTHCVQLGCCQDIDQGVIVCIDTKGQPIKIFMEFLNHSSFEGMRNSNLWAG